MYKNIIFIPLFVIYFNTTAQNVSFYKEDITFKIERGYFFVNGFYYLRNNSLSENKIALFYPFPTDSIYSTVDSIYILDIKKNQEIINYKKRGDGLFFNLKLDTTTTLLISYRQKLKSNEAKYILTTTKYWQRPLEEVTYKLITNIDLNITSFSYPPNDQVLIDSNIIYYWRKENFMPSRDMIFSF